MKTILAAALMALGVTGAAGMAHAQAANGDYPPCTGARTDECRQAQPDARHLMMIHHHPLARRHALARHG